VRRVLKASVEVTIYAVCRSIYLLFYHPLANYPGPRIAAISNAFYAYIWMGGRYPFEIEKLHNQYGPVVRIAPNELSFSTTQSFNDIYGHSGKDHQAFIKGTFYDHGLPEPGIVAERNPERHRETRRLLSHGFSAKALKEQEGLLVEYIDLFVSQLAKHGTKSTGVNMKEWFNWLSFDIIGELAFGESFGAVKAAKSHFWIDTIHDGAYLVTMFQIGRRLPLLWPFILMSIPLSFKKKFDLFLHFSKKQVQARVARQLEIGRQDFFSNLLSDKAENKSEEWLIAQANVLDIAGSDTTATALTTILYFLSKSPISLSRLQAEIRESFTAKGDMMSEALQGLPYLGAVIDEGLRIFPPTAFGLPRISPGALVDGYMVPAGVCSPLVHIVPFSCTDAMTDHCPHVLLDNDPRALILHQSPQLLS
jgi:cytochrome P450